MSSLFNTQKYFLNDDINVYCNNEYKSINYSDGDNIEQNIYEIISNTNDLSVLSSELRHHCNDWPTVYHLGSERANILRPFENILKGADVLEIGAGCGAITRFLGECGANVLAVEGSLRRAKIARSRTRDLDNVTVLAEKFADFETDHKFDVITLIGVLEYANLFTSSDTPTKSMLEDVYGYLKPNGKLIIAIENQLGLKYFAGAPEDHKWQVMYGIEGRYTKNDPETFGKHKLKNILKSAKFNSQQFFAPFPDYKTANSIISETAYQNPAFNAAALAIENTLKDHQLPNHLLFSQERTWSVIHDNNLGLDLANSFLIVASPEENAKPVLESNNLAFHYSTSRLKHFCKQTRFVADDAGKIIVKTSRFSESINIKEINSSLVNSIKEEENYIVGTSLNEKISKIITTDYWSLDDFIGILKKYLTFIYNYKDHSSHEYNPDWLDETICGSLIDCIPQNILISESNPESWSLIDQEWSYEGNVPLSWILFRVLLITVQSNTRLGYNDQVNDLTRREFFELCYKLLGFNITSPKLEEYASFEANFQSLVSGRDIENLGNWYSSQIIRTRNYIQESERFRNTRELIITQNKQLERQNNEISEFNIKVEELERIKSGLSDELARYKLNEQLIKASLSWKVTKPLRVIRALTIIPREGKTINWLRHKRNLANYLAKRIQSGVKRHGFINSIPLAIKTAGSLSINHFKKVQKSKLYQQKISELEQFILNEKNYIDLFHVPMGWHTPLFQRFQHLSLQAARLGGLALYGGHIQVDKELFVYEREDSNVIVFDALDSLVNEKIKAALKKNTLAQKVVRIQSIDLATTIDDILEFQNMGFKVVYEYIDEITEEIVGDFPETIINRHKWTLENESVFVIATATKLFEEVARHRSENMLLSTNGVDISHWHITSINPPDDVKPLLENNKAIIGYHGALAKWIDYDLLHRIADVEDFQLLLIGYEHDSSLKDSGLALRDNVHFLGSKSYFELPQYAYFYDVGILPFKKYKLTESVSPVKLFEYMALRKPVVTTDLVECLKYKSCLVADSENHDQFVANVKTAICLKSDEDYLKTLDAEALSNSWQSKTLEYLELVGVNVNKSIEGKYK
ncbi:methyltransferase [Lelliottia sp. RWM.1]|uniref:methyltransferase n=1 Tax=Lelliottia sp. RWM.1 TaxID=2663242 RepID=UPI00193E2E44|nr:methyltransferase [Lelliottia sp. RWM.1]MBM3071004.1 methyltransferase [Lelliottia sp. RWM.1]